ncbi:hypothetical protein EVAR_311_1 [Eumeta japonica]|uniref:Uncharacterized protein n=1 Tax=Eumeta variegata TaxID=151549 RepID=A0A4C1SCH7_EUMVA|nr:hypothetical protein EVAR_311_1 [Eumeta japonica]
MNDIVNWRFDIESLNVAPRKPSHDPEERVLALLDSNSVKLPTGQFETCLLWKSDDKVMPESYDTAMRRLRGIKKKLLKNDCWKNEYCKQINYLLKNEYAEPAPNKFTSKRLCVERMEDWDIQNDTLGFNLGLRNTPIEILKTSLPLTKRQVTSAVLFVFDPLGLASPVLITGKTELEEHTTVKYWRWVPMKLYVADDATRGPATEFDETHRWFRDPVFLCKNEDEWPQEILESGRRGRKGRVRS